MSDTALSIVSFSLLSFSIIGVFGNINIIIATVSNKRFHHKCGLLLGFLACCDLVCLCYEFSSFMRIQFNLLSTTQNQCFWSYCGYIFFEVLEVYTIVALALDRQLAISLPMSYRTFNTRKYLILILLPGVIFGICFVIASYLLSTNASIDVCVLPYSMPDIVSKIWNYYNMGGAIITMMLYVFTYAKLYIFKGLRLDVAQEKIQKTILSTVIIQAVVFFFSSVLSALIIMLVGALGLVELAKDASTLAVIPGLISYSCNYYVYFWRSSDCREAFLQQLFCRKNGTRELTRASAFGLKSTARAS